MNKEKTVVWVSKHPPLPSQTETLVRILGDLKLICISDKWQNANELYGRLKALGADYAVVVLPLSVTMHLLNCEESNTITYLRAEMEPANGEYNPNTDVLIDSGAGTKRHRRFREFRVLKAIEVVTEPFEVTNHGN
jgi:hypothetical protein